ncbi:hypothetical protein RFI_14622, partial [Reticulomyxa filosa]
GSFYANPLTDDPTNGNREWISQYPSFYHPNLWPVNSLPQLQSAFMETGQLVHEIGKLIAYQMDQLVSSVRPQYVKGTLVDVVGTNLPKGRLLYYFSSDEMKKFNLGNTPHGTSSSTSQGSSREDNWCGRFFDENGNHPSKMDDPVAGLYVKTRTNRTYHIQLSEKEASEHLAFQIGETSQILSGGALMATPHAVKGTIDARYAKTSRASFALFMQPNHLHHMRAPEGLSIPEIQFDRFLPPTVPPLSGRWWNETSDTFGAFTARTLRKGELGFSLKIQNLKNTRNYVGKKKHFQNAISSRFLLMFLEEKEIYIKFSKNLFFHFFNCQSNQKEASCSRLLRVFCFPHKARDEKKKVEREEPGPENKSGEDDEFKNLPNVRVLKSNEGIDDYFELERELGRGGSCRVLKVVKKQTGEKYAMKELIRNDVWNPTLSISTFAQHFAPEEYYFVYFFFFFFFLVSQMNKGRS